MACFLTAPSHYLNQCELTIKDVFGIKFLILWQLYMYTYIWGLTIKDVFVSILQVFDKCIYIYIWTYHQRCLRGEFSDFDKCMYIYIYKFIWDDRTALSRSWYQVSSYFGVTNAVTFCQFSDYWFHNNVVGFVMHIGILENGRWLGGWANDYLSAGHFNFHGPPTHWQSSGYVLTEHMKHACTSKLKHACVAYRRYLRR